MKRILSLILIGVMMFSLAACGSKPTDSSDIVSGSEIEDVDTEDTASDNVSSDTSADKNTESSNVSKTETDDKNSSSSKDSGSSSNNAAVNANLAQKVSVKKGSKPVEEGVNFGGKTFTMAITAEEPQYHDAAFKRKVAAFEKKFNCKIKLDELIFGTYNTQVQQALSAGKSYDIMFQHGSMYPVGVNDNLFKSFSDVITTADLQNASNPSAGGINLADSSYFAYKGELYGLSHYYSSYPLVMYYNKKMCSAAGIDPQKLYSEGKWTWNYILTTGRKVTKRTNNIFFLAGIMGIDHSYGNAQITMVNGKPKADFTSSGAINSFNMIKTMVNPSSGIMRSDTNSGTVSKDFADGKCYLRVEESSKWPEIVAQVKQSPAFGKDIDNLGIVPLPMATNDKSKYAFDWLRCVAAGAKTKDIRVAACWAKFEATWVDPVKDDYVIQGKNREIVDSLMKTTNKIVKHGRYYTTDKNTLDIQVDLQTAIVAGGDIAQLTKQAQQQAELCIKSTWK